MLEDFWFRRASFGSKWVFGARPPKVGFEPKVRRSKVETAREMQTVRVREYERRFLFYAR